jgi:peptide deformylase
MVEIVQKEHKILRGKAKEVPVKEIDSAKIKKIIEDMKKSLSSQDDGVAIAAPQISVPLRIFVVSGKIFGSKGTELKEPKKASSKDQPDLVFINPEIIKISKKKESLPEGCLSVRWLYGEVKRSTNATVRAYNERGEVFTRGGGGLLAQIFQHEIDHLDGILFIDKAKNLVELKPEDIEKNAKNAKK